MLVEIVIGAEAVKIRLLLPRLLRSCRRASPC